MSLRQQILYSAFKNPIWNAELKTILSGAESDDLVFVLMDEDQRIDDELNIHAILSDVGVKADQVSGSILSENLKWFDFFKNDNFA